MEEKCRSGRTSAAAMAAGVHRNTAGKYLRAGKLPSELAEPRRWRTRADPFREDWDDVVVMLRETPDLEAKIAFELLMERRPGRYEPGQLRTLQRRIRLWRAQEGPPKEVFFSQVHIPGEAMQTDFTWTHELQISIDGELFPHLLCHMVLPYSNWEWATICSSESLAALRDGVQAAVFKLGRVPEWHQTDNSTAATHDLRTGKRGFNEDYEALMRHLGLKPRTIEIGEKNQNGDVEAMHGALKRRLVQYLKVRGSCDFASRQAYQQWLEDHLERANAQRLQKLREELDAMKPLQVRRLAQFTQQSVKVSSWSTIRVKHNAYSVPSRLIGEWVDVRLYEDRLEVIFQGQRELEVERLPGRNGHRVSYRHIIWSLVRKPGAFRRYRYRTDLFPTLTFRRSYDALIERLPQHRADLEYLRLLHLAARTMETQVEAVLEALLNDGVLPAYDTVQARIAPPAPLAPQLEIAEPDLSAYDALLPRAMEV